MNIEINHKDALWSIEFWYEPEHGDNWHEPWVPESVEIESINGLDPHGIFAERFIFELEDLILVEMASYLEEYRADLWEANRYD